jgi:AcrR family transcriptional regulator
MSSPVPSPLDLPVLGSAHRERADATRNRARILCSAQRLFAERGVDSVSMDAIAEAAEVGKGTLFRRFGDRAALIRAVLEDTEAAFQEGFIRGPAPLGPGAPPVERLVAFGSSLLDLIESRGDLLLAAESGAPGMRFRHAVYGAYRAHVLSLLREVGPGIDPEYTADALLAALSVELVLHQRRGRSIPLADIRRGWEGLARRVAAS